MLVKKLLLAIPATVLSTQALAVTCGIGMDDSTCATPLRFPGCRVFDASDKFAYYQPDPALCAAGGSQTQNVAGQGEGGTDPTPDDSTPPSDDGNTDGDSDGDGDGDG